MKILDAPEFPGWRLVGEAPFPESIAQMYRNFAARHAKEARHWGTMSVVGIALLLVSPWIILAVKDSPAFEPVAIGFGLILLCIWFPIWLWRSDLAQLRDSENKLKYGGCWVYEPLTPEDLERFRASKKSEEGSVLACNEGFELEGSGRRCVMKKFDEGQASTEERRDPKLRPETFTEMKSLRIPAIGIEGTDEECFSRIGGNPLLPPNFVWPMHEGKAFAFMAQFDLSLVDLSLVDLSQVDPSELKDERLPESGYLYFFEAGADHGRVFYFPDGRNAFVETHPPQGKHAPERTYDFSYVTLEPAYVYPHYEEPVVQGLGLSDEEEEAYVELTNTMWPQRLLGVPNAEEYDRMRDEIHRASGRSQSADEWILLFQNAGVDDDGSIVLYWIRKADLAAANFDHVRMFILWVST